MSSTKLNYFFRYGNSCFEYGNDDFKYLYNIHTTPRTATSVMLKNNIYDGVLYARTLMRRNSSPRVEKVTVTRQ